MVECVINPMSGRAVKTSGRIGKMLKKKATTLTSAVKRTVARNAYVSSPPAPAKKRGRPAGAKNKKPSYADVLMSKPVKAKNTITPKKPSAPKRIKAPKMPMSASAMRARMS